MHENLPISLTCTFLAYCRRAGVWSHEKKLLKKLRRRLLTKLRGKFLKKLVKKLLTKLRRKLCQKLSGEIHSLAQHHDP